MFFGGCYSFNDVKNGIRLYCRITRHYAVRGNNIFKLAYTSENLATLKVVKLKLIKDDVM